MPRADDVPVIKVETHITQCTHNPLGVKGCGEVGTIGSPAAVINSVVDALSHLGVLHVDMPATPNRSGASSRTPQCRAPQSRSKQDEIICLSPAEHAL